jgi:hypothetical protein
MPFPFAFAWLNAIRAVRHSHKRTFLTTTTTMMMTQLQTLTLAMTATMTHTTTTTALCLDDHWALNANGTMRTPLAQRVAKHHQVKLAVDSILSAGNAFQQGALFRGVLDHP